MQPSAESFPRFYRGEPQANRSKSWWESCRLHTFLNTLFFLPTMRENLTGIIIVTLLMVSCRLPEKKPLYDIVRDDILFIPNITSRNVSLYGIGLGAMIPEVVAAFGQPDKRNELIIEGITNLEYGKKINLTDNGLIFHFENGTLTRMTIIRVFTEHYQTKTQLNFTKREVYEQFGIPDKQSTVLAYRVFTYDTQGIEIFLKGRNANRISFFVPRKTEAKKKEVPTATEFQANNCLSFPAV